MKDGFLNMKLNLQNGKEGPASPSRPSNVGRRFQPDLGVRSAYVRSRESRWRSI